MHMSNLCMCVYHKCQSLYHVWYHSCTVHMWNCVYDMYQYICACTLYSRAWQANFYKSLQIANLQILGPILLSQICKFLRCASPQIANPQISSKFCTSLSTNSYTVFCLEKKYVFADLRKFKSANHKKIGPAKIAHPLSVTFTEGHQI
jgi:hypothetical protein